MRRLAADVRQATDRLDVLVSNAGIGGGEPDGHDRRTSADGYELRFAVNYLAGFLLTLELLPLLRASAPARIVNVASLGQHPLDFSDLMLERGYSGIRAYGQSKLAQIMSGFELASRIPGGEVTVNSLHPATYMPTKIVLDEVGHSIDSIDEGVDATRRLVSDPALAQVTGRFFDRAREARADAAGLRRPRPRRAVEPQPAAHRAEPIRPDFPRRRTANHRKTRRRSGARTGRQLVSRGQPPLLRRNERRWRAGPCAPWIFPVSLPPRRAAGVCLLGALAFQRLAEFAPRLVLGTRPVAGAHLAPGAQPRSWEPPRSQDLPAPTPCQPCRPPAACG